MWRSLCFVDKLRAAQTKKLSKYRAVECDELKNLKSKLNLSATHQSAPLNGYRIKMQSRRCGTLSLARGTANQIVLWLACAVWLGLGLTVIGNAWPGELKSPVESAAPRKDYLVSTFLREGVDGFTIKLVHLIQSASNSDEAAGIFTRLALEQYPGHAVAQTLVAEISLPPGPCAKDRQVATEATAGAFYAVPPSCKKGLGAPN